VLSTALEKAGVLKVDNILRIAGRATNLTVRPACSFQPCQALLLWSSAGNQRICNLYSQAILKLEDIVGGFYKTRRPNLGTGMPR